MRYLELIFQRLEKNGPAVNLFKCVFGSSTVKFLGHQISAGGLSPTPDKVVSIKSYSKPADVRGLRRFLGIINFYNRFLKNAARTQAPLQRVIADHKKNSSVKLKRGRDMKSAFVDLKEDQESATLLTFPSPEGELSLATDASDSDWSCVSTTRQQQPSDSSCGVSHPHRKDIRCATVSSCRSTRR